MAYPGVFHSAEVRTLRTVERATGNGGLIMTHAENGIVHGPAGRQTLSVATHPTNAGCLPCEGTHEGQRIPGQVETVVSRGAVVISGREFIGRAGHGRYPLRGT